MVKEFEMKGSSWITQMDPKSKDKSPYKRNRDRFDNREEEAMCPTKQTWSDVAMRPQAGMPEPPKLESPGMGVPEGLQRECRPHRHPDV